MRVMMYLIPIVLLAFTSCKKDKEGALRYFEVGMKHTPSDWRDSSFVVATSNPALINQIEQQLLLSVDKRSHLNGAIVAGDGGYNKNGSHSFSWHFDEKDWFFASLSVEIYDGRAYTDLDLNKSYWQNTMKRFAPWGSYVKREIR
ncbi:MAG: hypothetical protein J7621_01245 [Niastella sp.]|nr:hypothetical protein [Niastella sp.]